LIGHTRPVPFDTVQVELAFWYEYAPLTAERAAARLAAITAGDDSDTPRAHPGVSALGRDLAGVPGVGEVTATATSVLASVDPAQLDAVRPAVLALADRHGLICFEPPAAVHLPALLRPAPPPRPDVRLECSDGEEIDFPADSDIDDAVARMGDELWFVILHRDRQNFMQVATGPQAGKLAAGRYALEFQDGSPDRHYRSEVGDLAAVSSALLDYAHQRDGWQRRHAWQLLKL
jgi:hypothetical protein